jgi:uncharacterized protein YecE (DUF72 family)
MVRGESGRGMQPNPSFLDPALASSEFIQPALDGLGDRIGALVFQLSPLPAYWVARKAEFFDRLSMMLQSLPPLRPAAPDGVIAVEVRNPETAWPGAGQRTQGEQGNLLPGPCTPKCRRLRPQLPMLRALWPGPLVCRWNLHRKHGAYGYEDAKGLYEPFDRLVDPDPETRHSLARVIAATVGAGHNAYVTINNKAEGSAPLSVFELARAVIEKPA